MKFFEKSIPLLIYASILIIILIGITIIITKIQKRKLENEISLMESIVDDINFVLNGSDWLRIQSIVEQQKELKGIESYLLLKRNYTRLEEIANLSSVVLRSFDEDDDRTEAKDKNIVLNYINDFAVESEELIDEFCEQAQQFIKKYSTGSWSASDEPKVKPNHNFLEKLEKKIPEPAQPQPAYVFANMGTATITSKKIDVEEEVEPVVEEEKPEVKQPIIEKESNKMNDFNDVMDNEETNNFNNNTTTTPRGGNGVSVIAKGSVIYGDLNLASSIQVEGDIQGSIVSNENVLITSQANIQGAVQASNVKVENSNIVGDIVAEDAVEVEEGSTVRGDVETPSLTVKGTIEGDIVGNALVFTSSAKVSGNIRASKLEVADGALISGKISIGSDY